MPEAEVAIDVLPLAHGENAARADDAVAADDQAAVVQRSLRVKNRDDEFRREPAVDQHAALDVRLDVRAALDGDERAEVAAGNIERRLREFLDDLLVLRRHAEDVMAAKL